ncbi:DUF2304 domain-containing protein [Clostridium sp. MSJ-4]|uniref:DUF2304 domain-containing protein n=1 Tax=Clostridium simiarum TaxID=2841506 RepID=A0ABS6F175_9CLOT|nr:DUF2304 domain-containing protein [Clostridium simiarum]MBU5591665.1 DUF2304 domain-containing protein [Clostridium simiarum]
MKLFCFMISLFFLVISIIFIRKRSLEFKSGLLWILVSLILMIFSVNSTIIESLAKVTGIMYPPAFLFLMGIIFSLVMIFYLMIVISNMQKKLTKLIQENSILKDRIEEK